MQPVIRMAEARGRDLSDNCYIPGNRRYVAEPKNRAIN